MRRLSERREGQNLPYGIMRFSAVNRNPEMGFETIAKLKFWPAAAAGVGFRPPGAELRIRPGLRKCALIAAVVALSVAESRFDVLSGPGQYASILLEYFASSIWGAYSISAFSFSLWIGFTPEIPI